MNQALTYHDAAAKPFTREEVDSIKIGSILDGPFRKPSQVLSIFAKENDIHGKVTEIVQHTSTWLNPDGTSGAHAERSQALAVECDHVPNITYTIHLTGYRVTSIIETTVTEVGK